MGSGMGRIFDLPFPLSLSPSLLFDNIPIRGEWLASNTPHVQAAVSRQLRTVRPPLPLIATLSVRLRRYFDANVASLAAVGASNIGALRPLVRSLFLVDILSVWLNAWCTSSRFGLDAPCRWCAPCGPDNVLALHRCPILAEILGPLLSLPPSSSLVETFCLTRSSPELLSRRALAISIARAMHNFVRTMRRVPSQNVLYSLAVARLRKYARDDRRLGALLRRGTFSRGRFSLPPVFPSPASSL